MFFSLQSLSMHPARLLGEISVWSELVSEYNTMKSDEQEFANLPVDKAGAVLTVMLMFVGAGQ